ncbi:baseplate J/gp47 family protein [Desulfuromonas thiophila]|uniref:baseplate J/gp47 family protein n=1 Tax=Desulfuromonas thiophila TaxID=57664 RepID=UPI0029F5895B|nr:baseplate J/gp47 family protein [Desulfuromonas thiophila]
MSSLPTRLPEPDFVGRDVAAITAELIAAFETALGKTLYPAQVERVVLDQIAYREALLRIALQYTGLQNLAQYARAEMLDHLGALTGAVRLSAAPARLQLQISCGPAAPAATLVLPAGSRATSTDGAIVFVLEQDAVLPPGSPSAQVWAAALLPGAALNGIAPGQISVLPGHDPQLLQAVNVTTSVAGADVETDDHLRARVMLSPEREACGTLTAYRLAALSTHADILDVAVTCEGPGLVRVSAATATGSPDESLLDLLRSRLNAAEFKPLTDQVSVTAPDRVPFELHLQLWLYPGAGDAPLGAVRTALEAHCATLRKTLGRDLVPSRFIALAQNVAGVQSVVLHSPAARVLSAHEWADCTALAVTVAGVSND